MEYKNVIWCGDCREKMMDIPDGVVDLCVTSPPYNVDLGNNKLNKSPYDLYRDNLEHKEYIKFLRDIFEIVYRKLKSGGRLVINIGDGKNGAVATSSDLIQTLSKDLSYILMTQIIWDKRQIGNRTAWGSFQSPSCPSFPTPFEHILVFAKDSIKLLESGETDLTKKEFIDYAYAIWQIAPENRMSKFGHPAMFPEELVYRIIKMLTWKGSVVLDPFGGCGTTAVVARELGRVYIHIDLSQHYCDIAEQRIKELDLIPKDLF